MSLRRALSPSRYLALALLLILAFLQLSTLSITSPTMDEPDHIVSGYAFLTRGDTRIKLNGPMLPNLIGALPLLLEPNLKLTPANDPMWDLNDHNGIADPFIWNNTASPFQIIYLSRLPFMAISWLLGALIFRWASQRAGSFAGLLGLALYVSDPNLLAHSRLAMTDFEPTAVAFFALYAIDRSLRQPSRQWRLIAGIALGLMLASKFSLLTFAAAMMIITFIIGDTTEPRGEKFLIKTLRLSVFAVELFFIAAITVWAVYAFQIAPVNAGGLPVPAAGFWREWQSAQLYLNQPWPNYLFGQTSFVGWWYYFPIAFALKTPLPILILLVIALVRSFTKRSWRRDLIFLLPPLLLFGSLLFSTNNLGYRYLLPVLPLIFVYVSDLGPRSFPQTLKHSFTLSPLRLVTLLLLAWQIIGVLHIYPYYLTYFNEIAGGPDRGRYLLSDSNIDWGQDLVGLKNYVDQQRIDQIKLSYFGIAHPTAYDMRVEALLPVRTALNDQGAWWLKRYTPIDPAPGTYAISVANLMGGIWIDPSEYRFFRDRTPDAIIGNSIYIYTINSRGNPIDLSLAGLQIDQIDPATYQRFNTNNVRPRWFNATSSLIAAPGEAWIAIADNQALAPEFANLLAGMAPNVKTQTLDDHQTYQLYHFDLGQRLLNAAQQATQDANGIQLPVKLGDTAELLGYDFNLSGRKLTLMTYWRAGDHIITPLQLFVHAVAPDGSIAAQEDRLDAPAFGWRSGDVVAQISRLVLAEQSGSVGIEVGLYNQATGNRLPVVVDQHEVGQRLLLKQIELK